MSCSVVKPNNLILSYIHGDMDMDMGRVLIAVELRRLAPAPSRRATMYACESSVFRIFGGYSMVWWWVVAPSKRKEGGRWGDIHTWVQGDTVTLAVHAMYSTLCLRVTGGVTNIGRPTHCLPTRYAYASTHTDKHKPHPRAK